jgi:hypothetical protein
MGSVSSDRSERDGQFQGRIMDVAQYPNPSFGGFVSVGDTGAFEVLLNLIRSGSPRSGSTPTSTADRSPDRARRSHSPSLIA